MPNAQVLNKKNKMTMFNDKRGLTLIEMLVAISITIILLGTVSVFLIRSFYLNKHVVEQGLNISVLQNSLRNFSANLREARQAEDGSYLLASCQEYEVVFYADTDNDGISERLTYYLENNQFKLEITEPNLGENPVSYSTGTSTIRIIGAGIVNAELVEPIFYYYEEDAGVPLETGFSSSQVELVRIRIYANADTENAPDAMVMETLVRPRNIP